MSSDNAGKSGRGEVRLTADMPEFNDKVTPETLRVFGFSLDEGVNELYRLEVVVGLPPGLVANFSQTALLNQLVLLIQWDGGGSRTVGGRIAEIEFLGLESARMAHHEFYRLIVRPSFWFSGQTKRNRVFTFLQPRTAVSAVFADYAASGSGGGLDPDNLPVSCTIDGKPPEKWEPGSDGSGGAKEMVRPLIHQWDESDHDFVLRWIERMGWRMHFAWKEAGGADGSRPERLPYEEETLEVRTLPGAPPDTVDMTPAHRDPRNIGSLRYQVNSNPVSKKFVLHDYNPDRPNLGLTAEYPQGGDKAKKAVTLTDEFFDTVKEGETLAQIRHEAAACHAVTFRFESNLPAVRAGCVVKHNDGKSTAEVFVTRVHHEAMTNLSEFAGDLDTPPQYANSFEGVAADKPYRPLRTRPWPQIPGIVEGWVLPYKDGAMEAVTTKGRYHVYIKGVQPIPKAGGDNGSTNPLFMGQPTFGYQTGTSMPLHAGTPVAIAFRSGNPDRPFILNAMPDDNDRQTHITDVHSIFSHGGGLSLGGGVTDWGTFMSMASSNGSINMTGRGGLSTIAMASTFSKNSAALTAASSSPFQTHQGSIFTRFGAERAGWVSFGLDRLTSLGPRIMKMISKSLAKATEEGEEVKAIDEAWYEKAKIAIDLVNFYGPFLALDEQSSRLELTADSDKSYLSQVVSSNNTADLLSLMTDIGATVVEDGISYYKSKQQITAEQEQAKELGGELEFNVVDKKRGAASAAKYLAFPVVLLKLMTQTALTAELGHQGVRIAAKNSSYHESKLGTGARIWKGVKGGSKPLWGPIHFIVSQLVHLKKKKLERAISEKLLTGLLKNEGYDIGLLADGPVHAVSNDNVMLSVRPYSDKSGGDAAANFIALLLDEPDKGGKLYQRGKDATVEAADDLRLIFGKSLSMWGGKSGHSNNILHVNGHSILEGTGAGAVNFDKSLHLVGKLLAGLHGKSVVVGGGHDGGVALGLLKDGKIDRKKPHILIGQEPDATIQHMEDTRRALERYLILQLKMRKALLARVNLAQQIDLLGGTHEEIIKKAKFRIQQTANLAELAKIKIDLVKEGNKIKQAEAKIKAAGKNDNLVVANADGDQKVSLTDKDIEIASKNKVVVKAADTQVEAESGKMNIKSGTITIAGKVVKIG